MFNVGINIFNINSGESGGGEPTNNLLDNIAAYYKLDESSGDAIDSVNGNNGTNFGGTRGSSGIVGTCYTFNGSNNYINIDAMLPEIISDTVGTMSAWVKPVDGIPGDSNGDILSVSDAGSSTLIHIAQNSAGKLIANARTTAGSILWNLSTDNVVFSDDTWTHVAITQAGGGPTLYVDGVAVDQTFSVVASLSAWFDSVTMLDTVRIGNLTFSNNVIQHFNGDIDEVGIWSRGLTSDEILLLYNSGSGLSYPF